MTRYVGLDVSPLCWTGRLDEGVRDLRRRRAGERVWAGTSRTDPEVIAAVFKRRAPGAVKVGDRDKVPRGLALACPQRAGAANRLPSCEACGCS